MKATEYLVRFIDSHDGCRVEAVLNGGAISTPMSTQQSFFFRGDEYTYTGETRQFHGATFYVGTSRDGREAVTQTPAGGVSPYVAQRQAEWKAQQADFAKLHIN